MSIFLNILIKRNQPSCLVPLSPIRRAIIGRYEILPLPVRHSVPTLGYQITSSEGKALFYTGDTGPGISACWEYISPQLLITEVAGPNKFEDWLNHVGHLSANLLKKELVQFSKLKGCLPRVTAIHMALPYESEIRGKVAQVAEELGADISLGYEDMKVTV